MTKNITTNIDITEEISKIELKFDCFLDENDSFHNSKIDFCVYYNPWLNYYKITTFSANEKSDSRQYFINNFRTKAGQEKLERFQDENNIGLVTY
jgi:hypothetical protein